MTVKTAHLDRGFEITEIDDTRTRISGKGPGIMGLCIVGVIMFIITTVLLAGILATFSGILGLVVLVGMPLYFHVSRSRSFAFELTDKGLEVGGKLYPAEDISKVFVFNKSQGGDLSSSVFVYNPSVVTGGAMALGSATGTAGARVLYKVGFMYGRKRIFLAQNITEDMAESLFAFLTETR